MGVGARLICATASGASMDEHPRPSTPECPEPPRKLSLALLNMKLEPTVIQRAPAKSRASVLLVDVNVADKMELAASSPSTSGGGSSNNSGKSSIPSIGSTAKTSLDSKVSSATLGTVQSVSENRQGPLVGQMFAGSGSLEHSLASIQEMEMIKVPDPMPSLSSRAAPARLANLSSCEHR